MNIESESFFSVSQISVFADLLSIYLLLFFLFQKDNPFVIISVNRVLNSSRIYIKKKSYPVSGNFYKTGLVFLFFLFLQ